MSRFLRDRWSARESRRIALLGLVIGGGIGTVFFIRWLPNFTVRDSPIVTGRVVARDEIGRGPGGVELSIHIIDTTTTVRAWIGNYLMTRIPELVRFRYNGDASREVFLYEHEEDPFWIFLLCWLFALCCFGLLLCPERFLHKLTMPLRR